MSPKHKKTAKSAAKKTASHAVARVKHARATVKKSPGLAKRFLNSTPVRVLLGASAMALVLAKLKQRFA